MTETKSKPKPAASETRADQADATAKDRIAKVMARAGLCSRRDAEAWIIAGRVAVNGTTLTTPALNIGPEDRITVDGQAIEARERTRLFLYHKPRGLVTTAKDPEGRATVFDRLPAELPRLVAVGRLDINTEGLLLLTNDGGLARVLELPKTGWLRRYRVRANGRIEPERLEALKDGITVDGVDYAGIEATLDRSQGANVWLTMGLREGKNREIKRVLEHLGLRVNRLIRLSFGPFQLGDIAEEEVEEVRPRVLRDQLGEALAQEAGVDWVGAATAEVVTQTMRQDAQTRPARGKDKRAPSGDRNDRVAPTAPRQDRPKPGARPHVSALRAERPRAEASPRTRVTRAKTADRKGRTVAVERITVARKDRHAGEGGTSRNARNFARARREAETADAAGDPSPTRTRRNTSATAAARPRASFGSDRPATGRALKDAKRSSGKGPREAPAQDRNARPPRSGEQARPQGGRKPRTGDPRPAPGPGGPTRPGGGRTGPRRGS